MLKSVRKIAIAGNPSTGKSTSLRNLDPKTTIIITPNKKPLPIKGSSKLYTELSSENPTGNRIYCPYLTDEKDRTGKIINYGLEYWLNYIKAKRLEIKTIVVEDITHFFQVRINSKAFTTSADRSKWATYAQDMFISLIHDDYYNDGVEVIHIWHSKKETINGVEKYELMTFGQASRASILPASWYTYVFFTHVLSGEDEPDVNKRYKFVTNCEGAYAEAKSPLGCFDELYIPNDARQILDIIAEYES